MLEYDSVVKDKLVKVGDKPVTYGSNPLVPMSYDGNTYTFEGRRLARIQKGGKTIDYTYNDQGLRTKKTVAENGTSSETQFFYDGTKLIAEISPEHRFDFLYDENDRLYGFVLDKTATYFYVRDTLENVLGIVDSTGNLVVQYAYNAWGKNLGITGTLATTVGAYNPIRYKGYHFDSDTGMYYCHTRYYVPDWCRWLCGDSIAYIRPDILQQMNLFAYCCNNPISFLDPEGTKKINWKAIGKILFSAFVVSALAVAAVLTAGTAVVIYTGAAIGAGIGMAAGIANGIIQGQETGNYLDAIADNMVTGTIVGGLSGALAASGVPLAGQILGNAVLCGGSYLISCEINGTNPNFAAFCINTVGGGFAGLVGGKGYFADSPQIITPLTNYFWALSTSILKGAFASWVNNAIGGFAS